MPVRRMVWVVQIAVILQLLAFGTATSNAGTAIASPTPTATATPVPLAGSASGFNGVTGDCNENSVVSIDELVRGVNIALERQALENCRAFDADNNGRVTVDELVLAVGIALRGAPPTFTPTQMPSGDLVALVGSSPANGEGGVAVTRETVLRFDGPVDPSSVTQASIMPTYGGGGLFARLHVSPDGRSVTLFYEVFLPSSARVRVTVNGGLLRGANGMAVDADGDGQPGGVALIDFDTLNLTTLPGTAVCGRVFASHLIAGANGTSMNVPLPGVTIEVDGAAGELNAVTDQFGNFRLEPAPVGRFFVFIRGTTATVGVPLGAYYPDVGKAWEAVAGVETTIGDVFLPLIEAGTLQPVSATSATVIRFPDSVRQEFPELADVQLTVPADSLFDRTGTRGGMVGIAPVAPDRIPSRLPPGLDFPLVITVQTDGGENFDRPVPVCFPNLPDRTTGQPLAPGAESALWSFNHDTGEFEVVGAMRVTADGRLVCTEPGVGIIAPGWHGSAPGASGGGGPIGGPGNDDQQEKGGGDPPGGPGRRCRQSGDGDDVVDPVYLFSGELYEEVTDLRIAGRGVDFVWSRKYRSKIGPNTVQGNGWDFSYNISLLAEGADLVVCDGNSRRDTYGLSRLRSTAAGTASGTSVSLGGRIWTRPEQFNELTQNSDGTFTLTFPDGGTWLFNPIDGSPAQGKIRASTDRNGNRLGFAYDGSGLLTTVTDTLDRTITVAYDADGFITSVTDFSGRQVRYEYYQDSDTDGARGDLKSVRSPIVTGTVNRNDFPTGKLTTYTYTTGFADDRLNHNLLTITDGRRNDPTDPTFGEGPYVINTYADTEDPDNVDFDRVVRQLWGGPRDIVDMVYVPQTPSAANGQAYMKTIVNDRVGNVTEYFFERGNRVVIRREYTGRAEPDRPTTETSNRPTGKLRADDPAFFETRYEWNDDSLMTRAVHANGNSIEYIYESDLDPNAAPRARGNLRRSRHLAGRLAPISDQPEIVEELEYDDRFGCGQCGGQFVTRRVDGRGNATLHQYDDRGNLTQTTHRINSITDDYEYNSFGQMTAHTLPDNGSGHRRRDEYQYSDSGPQRGYLQRIVVDTGGFALTTAIERDAVGNIVRLIDPRGNDTLYTVNQLDQIVRIASRAVTDGDGVRYRRDYFYDANSNLVRRDIQNVDEAGAERSNGQITQAFAYEVLNHLVRRTEEVDSGRSISTEYEYDGNRNLTLKRHGEATSGRQPGNVERYRYDERDRLFERIAGEDTPEQSTTQYNYDGNANLRAVRRGLEDTPRTFTRLYDGFDRLVRLTDPMGNVGTWRYDENGNPITTRVDGELQDVEGSAANVRLAEVSYRFDANDRLAFQSEAFFDLETQTAIGDGNSTNTLSYNGVSQPLGVIDDNGHERRFTYDGANRLRIVTDAKNNTAALEYDANSSIVSLTTVEKSDLGGPDETFVTGFAYDNLDRLVQRVDNAGNTRRYAYDSRGDVVRVVDARGNITRNTFDGLHRPLTMTTELRENGAGTGNVVDEVTTANEWDDSSRRIREIDDNGQATTYVYDALDRQTTVNYADGTRRTHRFDVHHDLLELRDTNGTVVRNTFDLLGRMVERAVTRAPGVEGTTAETFAYNGRSQMVLAQDDDSTVNRRFDTLSHLVGETLNGETTVSTYDGADNQLTCRYPGGRQITNRHDELDRTEAVADESGDIATYAFIGPRRVLRRDSRNGTRAAYEYDGVQRITRTTHATVGATPSVLDDRSYTWDPMFNKTSRRDLRSGGRRHDYRYDSLQRLIASDLAPATGSVQSILYTLDGLDNRLRVGGGALAGDYRLSAVTPEPADLQMSQYTETSFDTRRYDANGNLIEIDMVPGGAPTVRLAYDYRNHMVRYENVQTSTNATYAYDPLGRRIGKTVDDGTPETTRFFYDRWRVVEEQDGGGTTQASYVYGHYLDDVLSMRRSGADFFYHNDDLYNVMAVSDDGGTVVERYDYGDYGEPEIRDPAGALRQRSAIGNPYLFTGRRFDPESGLYDYRMRYLDPRAGRFTTRDPLGIWGDPSSRGNGFAYAGSNPFSRVDPFGLFVVETVAGIALEQAAVGVTTTAVGAAATTTATTAAGGAAATVAGGGALTVGGVVVLGVGAATAVSVGETLFPSPCNGTGMLDPGGMPLDPCHGMSDEDAEEYQRVREEIAKDLKKRIRKWFEDLFDDENPDDPNNPQCAEAPTQEDPDWDRTQEGDPLGPDEPDTDLEPDDDADTDVDDDGDVDVDEDADTELGHEPVFEQDDDEAYREWLENYDPFNPYPPGEGWD